MRDETRNREPIAEATHGGPTRSRSGCSHVPFRNCKRIGLLVLGTIALAWLPIDGMLGDPTPARARGLGDNPILGFAFAPDGATIAAIQAYRVTLRDAKGVGGAITVLDRPEMARVLAFSPDSRSLFVGGDEPDLFLYRIGEDGAEHPLAMPIRRPSSLAVSPDGRVLAASSYLDPEILLWDLAAGPRGCGVTDPTWSAWRSPPMGDPWPRAARAMRRSSCGISPPADRDGGWASRWITPCA